MLELLGPTSEADKPNTCIDIPTMAIPVGIFKLPETDHNNLSHFSPEKELENPSQIQTPVQLLTPLKKTKEKLRSTPRRSPRLNYLRCLQYEDISPVKCEESKVSSWDETFVQSSQVLLDLDNKQTEQSTCTLQPEETHNFCNEGGDFSQPEPVECQYRQQETLYQLVGITESETQIAGNVLIRIGQSLLGHSNANLRPERPKSFSVLNQSASRSSDFYVNPLIDDSSNVPTVSSAPSEEIELNQSIKKLCWNHQSSENLKRKGKPWNADRGS